MEFQEYALHEVSALIDRLVSDAESRTEAVLAGSQREHDAAIAAIRAQLEQQARELERRIHETEQLTADGEEMCRQLAALRTEAETDRAEAQRRELDQQRKLAAATAAAEKERQAARAALDAAEVEMRRVEAEHQEALAAANALAEQERAEARELLDAARAEAERLEAAHQKGLATANAAAETSLAAAGAALEAAQAETKRVDAEHKRSLAAANAATEKELAAARTALEAARTETRRLETEHKRNLVSTTAASDKELAAARTALEAARAETKRIDAEHHTKLTAASAAAEKELSAARSALEAARAESKRLAAEHQRSLAEAHDASGLELRDARAALEAAQAEAQRLTRQFDSALEELRQEHVSTLQQQAVARTALPLDELLTVFGALASASTPSAVLTNVVSGLGREFARVALFRVRGGRLECVNHVGFEFEGDVAKVVIPTSVDSLMTRAVNTKRTQRFVAAAGDEACAVPFGGAPACAVALPLISGDTPVAVVYADDSDQLEFGSVPAELLVKFAELVWQHAILVLQRASAAQKMLAVAPVQSFERPA